MDSVTTKETVSIFSDKSLSSIYRGLSSHEKTEKLNMRNRKKGN
jgi:hypothetical protein|tara:strand:- start:269 stop:400 length:132 start_codon:yes stop_codon:yes gene_type:complete